MSIFKIMPHPMIGTLYQGEYTKVVKLRLKQDKRLPKHQQEDYNVFLIATDGAVDIVLDEEQVHPLLPGDLFFMDGQNEFSVHGKQEENPFLYFIIPQTNALKPEISHSKLLGNLYSDDLIQFARYQLTQDQDHCELSGKGDEFLVLCYLGQVVATRSSDEKAHPYKLMQGDVLHFSGDELVKIQLQGDNALILVAHLRLA